MRLFRLVPPVIAWIAGFVFLGCSGNAPHDCPSGNLWCDGRCVFVMGDTHNCGGCELRCGDGEVCVFGECASECPTGYTQCGDSCFDTKSDRFNCGWCNNPCAATELCQDNNCVAECQGGTEKCGDLCVNKQTNNEHCGVCFHACVGDQTCQSGSCQSGCQDGTIKCGATCSNTQTDPLNCQTCGHSCQSGDCVGGVCILKSTDYSMPVLVISYFPVSGNNLDSSITGLSTPLTTIRAKVAQVSQDLVATLENGSTYRKDLSSTPSLDYSIAASVEYLEPLPVSTFHNFDWCQPEPPENCYFPNYKQILQRENICNWVDNAGVKEVWLFGYHHGNIAPAESKMSGPFGDISNSVHYNDRDMVICSKTYVLYHYNYGRDLDCATENHTHHIEAVLSHIDEYLFWDTFVSPYGQEGGVTNGCGWTHYPPNGKQDYDWVSTLTVKTDCEDWNPQRNGATKMVNCSTWSKMNGNTCVGDGGLTHKIWWMHSIPGKNNNLTYQGQPLRNWWDAIANFDVVMASGRKLLR
jgi:hypothetical protein